MLTQINQAYDALLVIFDSHKESTLKPKLENILNEREMIYYVCDERNSFELSKDIQDKIQNGEVVFPKSRRIVFCYDLDLSDLDQEWIEQYKEHMNDFFENFGAISADTHYHVTLFRYQTGDIKDENKQEQVAQALSQFYSESMGFNANHVEFLMYHHMLETLEQQEVGIVRYLSLLTMKDWAKLLKPAYCSGYLCLVAYDSYTRNNISSLERKIQELTDWLNVRKDPSLYGFWNFMEAEIKTTLEQYLEVIQSIKDWEGVYPISSKDFKPKRFLGFLWITSFTKKVNAGNDELEQLIHAYRKDYIQKMEESNMKERLNRKLNQFFTYGDFFSLEEVCRQDNDIKRREKIKTYMDFAHLREDEKSEFQDLFDNMILGYVTKRLAKEDVENKQLSEIEIERLEKQEELNYLQEKKERIFSNIMECFEHIEERVAFSYPIRIGRAKDINKIALVSSTISQEWTTQHYQIKNIDDDAIYQLNGVGDLDVQCLKLGSCTSELSLLSKEEKINILKKLIS